MLTLLKNLHDRIESIKGKNLFILLIIVFITFIIIGLLIGYFTNKYLNTAENLSYENPESVPVLEEKTYEGKIKYIDPNMYKEDELSFVLIDNLGNEIILLKATDDKLSVAENLSVRVHGYLTKSIDKTKDILLVERISINGSD